jgi:hypothetical protein
MTNLSPEALSVWCRFCEVVEDHGPPRLGLAAALCAAADQVVPIKEEPSEPPGYGVGYEPAEYLQDWTRWHVRSQFLAIADELEGAALAASKATAALSEPELTPTLTQQALNVLAAAQLSFGGTPPHQATVLNADQHLIIKRALNLLVYTRNLQVNQSS